MSRSLVLAFVSAAACSGPSDQLTRVDVATYEGNSMASFVGGSSARDLWIAKQPATLAHWDGSAWKTLTVSRPPATGTLLAVYPGGPDTVWVVADDKIQRVSVDGTVEDFTSQATFSGNCGYTFYAGGGAAWLVGCATGGGPEVLHFSGGSFVPLASPPPNLNRIVNVLADDDAWGIDANSSTDFHWNGASWTAVTPPTSTDLSVMYMQRVGANDAWAVGAATAVDTPSGRAATSWKLLHWDGSQLQVVPAPLETSWRAPANGTWTGLQGILPMDGHRYGLFSWRVDKHDEPNYVSDVEMNVLSGATVGGNVHVYRIADGCYPSCTGITWGTAFPDGTVVLLLPMQDQPNVTGNGPVALLIGKPSD